MTEILSTLLDVSVFAFAVSSMLSVGFGNSIQRILGPLRDVRKVFRAVVANFVLVPLVAYGVLQLIPLEMPRAMGLFLIASAAGAPFLIKLVEAAVSDVALSASLLVLLLPATIVYLPIVVPLALPEADVNTVGIATPLVVSMLLPLTIGLWIRGRAEGLALRLRPIMQKTSTVALVVLILATILVNVQGILNLFDLATILATILIIGGAFGIGFMLGGPDRESWEVLGLGTGQRNIAAAMVVASQIGIPETLSMVVVASLVGLAILFALAAVLRRYDEEDQAELDTGRRKAA